MPSTQEYYDAALRKIQDADSFFNRPKKEERKKLLEEACDCLNSALSQGMLDAGIKLLEIYEKNKSVLFDKTTAEDLLRLMEQLIYKIIKILPDDEEKQKDIIHKLVALIEQFKDGELLCTMSRACSSSLMTNEILDLAHRSTTKKGDAKSKVMASYCYLALSERDDLPSEVYDSEETKVISI